MIDMGDDGEVTNMIHLRHGAWNAKEIRIWVELLFRVAMISLETIGFYSFKPKSQYYPFPLHFFIPIQQTSLVLRAIFRTTSAKSNRAMHNFFHKKLLHPVLSLELVGQTNALFGELGIAESWVTDTAFFRYPYYYTKEDTPDKLDYESFTRMVWGLTSTLRELAKS